MRQSNLQTGIAIAFITLLGLGIRLAIVGPAVFPLNDGGLFYTMIADLTANGLRLPTFSGYNAAAIPFAYPPLPFYLYAILHLTSRIPVTTLMQFGPAIVSTATIPAFFSLARKMLKSAPKAALATLVFALLPRAFDWLIMGGGVTRSLGMLFGLLAMAEAYVVFQSGDRKALYLLIFFASLVVYSHPEAATHTAIAAGLLYLWKGRTAKGLAPGLAAAVGTVVLTSPWWATIIARDGVGPFVAVAAAARAGGYTALGSIIGFLRLDFADEPFIAILTALGLLGIAFELSHRKYLLPTWLLGTYLLEPRGAPTFMMIPLAMSAAIGLDGVLLPALERKSQVAAPGANQATPEGDDWLGELLRHTAAKWVLGFVVIFSAVSAYAVGWRIRENLSVRSDDVKAFAWVSSNTAVSSKFALITGQLPLRDATSEWFPALTNRQSVATVFGYEWVNDGLFGQRLEAYGELQACAHQSLDCLKEWISRFRSDFDYVYVTDPSGVGDVPLSVLLEQSPDFESVYRSPTIAIYALK